MPAFHLNGLWCAFASRKNYVSLRCKPETVEKHRDKLGKLNVGKGCIRFRNLDDLPIATVRQILKRSAS